MLQKKKNEEVAAFLGKDSEFTGKFIFKGYARLDGKFSGGIFGEGTLAVGEGASITGDIAVDDAIVSGAVEGEITAGKKVKIYPTGKIIGTIRTPALVIEEGAFFEGTSIMSVESEKKAVDSTDAAKLELHIAGR